MNSTEPPVLLTPARRRRMLFYKIAGICGLILVLHVPLSMTRGVLAERQGYQAQATEAIAGVWGRHQLVTGPVLVVPYAYKVQVVRPKVVNGRAVQVEETELANAAAYFLPETLTVSGDAEPELRHRGIYDAVVYTSKLKMTGYFQPDFAAAGVEADRIDWDKAQVQFGVSDLHGVRSVGPLKSPDSHEATFESADGVSEAFLALTAKASGVSAGARWAFSLNAVLQGSERLEIAPVGKSTIAELQSRWPDPSFVGASLPTTRQVGADGFKAQWQTSHFSRGFPQSWTSRHTGAAEMGKKIDAASFGVQFAQPVTGYCMADRAQKYGVLFFVLVFAVFFLFEMTAALRIHPLQYALVGAALCLFFIAFLALSEFWPTGWAYGVAGATCTLMVALYAWTFLRTGCRTFVIGGGLGATYGYLYFVLKSQDYALVAGTVALFAVLALVMFGTRRIDWYRLESAGNATEPAKG